MHDEEEEEEEDVSTCYIATHFLSDLLHSCLGSFIVESDILINMF